MKQRVVQARRASIRVLIMSTAHRSRPGQSEEAVREKVCDRRLVTMTFFRTLPSRPLLRLAAVASARSRRPTRLPGLSVASSSSTPFSAVLQCRAYAKRVTSTAELIPGSQQPIADPAAQKEYANAETKMKASFEWFRKDCAEAETRSTGRVTPAILSPVRVRLPNSNDSYRLEDLAIVGVKEGTTLVVTVFEEDVSNSLTCILCL